MQNFITYLFMFKYDENMEFSRMMMKNNIEDSRILKNNVKVSRTLKNNIEVSRILGNNKEATRYY